MERQGMNSELEAEGRLRSLSYKVRAASKESQSQRASQVLDSDLRTHWSTGTNAKEWILLELEESCLLSHIRIHNKSVLEWEISISLRNKPETFVKVRPRCEAPRRDITYNIGHLPCRYVRIACLRGNPIAIFHVQLVGISIPGLEPELQPVVDHFLPQIIARIKEPHDVQLQLLQDISIRLSPFLQQLEGDLSVPIEAMDSTIRFLAMLVGPFYPFLALFRAVRENEKLAAVGGADEELGKSSLASVFTVSSNFQAPPKRIRSPGLSSQSSGQSLALRPNSVVMLLKLAYKDAFLSNVCKKVARLLRKLSLLNADGLRVTTELPGSGSDESTVANDTPLMPADYSRLFGEEYRVTDDDSLDLGSASTLDISIVEEALLHLLYACASQPLIIRRLAEAKSDLSPVLPLLQSLLPALRPPTSSAANADVVDETFWQWQAPLVQRALNQVVALVTAPSYRPLLDACAGYLSAYSPAHEKSACVLIDLCAGPLAPWLAVIIAKVDLAIELLEDLLGNIQAGHEAPTQARAVLVYLVLALSGHVDDVLNLYKIVKHKVLFVIEMLEPYLIPAIIPVKSSIAFGDVSAVVLDKHERTCDLALELLRTALQKPTILPAMEAEWRRGNVAPSVLLSILAPHVALPPGIDHLKYVKESGVVAEGSPVDTQIAITFGSAPEEAGASEAASKGEVQQNEDATFLFAPLELKGLTLLSLNDESEGSLTDDRAFLDILAKLEGKSGKKLLFDIKSDEHEWDLKSEYWQLVDASEREQRASDFIRFASELNSRQNDSFDSQQSAVDALLLAAECHVNPFFMMSSKEHQKMVTRLEGEFLTKTARAAPKVLPGPDLLAQLEEERDKAVLNILMCAAEWDTLGVSDSEGTKMDGESSQDLDDVSCDIGIDDEDRKVEDAVTLVRQRQGMLCRFLVRQLQRDRHNLYEVLLQGLLFVLHSATQLSSTPEDVIDVIIGCATRLNVSLVAYHNQGPNGILSLGPGTFHGVRRQWVLLRKLVLVASGGEVPADKSFLLSPCSQMSHLHQDLIPGSAWMSRVSQFATSPYPLVRYIGWMGVAQYAQLHTDNGVPLIDDLQDFTSLLLIFSDELISVELLKHREAGETDIVDKAAFNAAAVSSGAGKSEQSKEADPGNLVKVLYPEFSRVFPSLRLEFSQFGDTLLQAIYARIEVIPRSFVPDMLSWFSEVCLQPFPARQEMRGFTLGNARYVIMRLLEVILLEHVEAILPELSRVFQVVISLCSSSYCDVTLLEAVLKALKPIISHATSSASNTEGETSVEILSYETVMQQLKAALSKSKEENGAQDALALFLGGFLLSSVSYTRRNNVLIALKSWVDSRSFGTYTGSLLDTLSALQKLLDECLALLKEIAGENCSHSIEKNHVTGKQGLHSLVDGANPLVLGTPDSEALDSSLGGDTTEGTVSGERDVEVVNGDVDAVDVETLETLEPLGEKDVERPGWNKPSQDTLLFRQKVQELALALGPSLEISMKLHPQVTSRVAVLAAQCLYYAGAAQDPSDPALGEQALVPSVKALGSSILTLQKGHCWQVASTSTEYLLSLPSLSDAYFEVCSILEHQCTHAPRVAWRLSSVHWLAKAFTVESLAGASDALVQLLNTMLEHPEPEQRAGVLRQVEKVIEEEEDNLGSKTSAGAVGGQRSALETFVSAMWIPVVTSATSDASARLRKQASDVLVKMVPYVESSQLQSLLVSFDMIFKSQPLTQSGLSLLARVCLYSNPPDYDTIPSRVWDSIESLAQSKPGRKFVKREREFCQALIQLRNVDENAKEYMRKLLTSAQENAKPPLSSNPVREAVVEVLARLSVLRSEAEFHTSATAQEAVELEEAEIEMELLREERAVQGGDGLALTNNVDLASFKGSSSDSRKDRLKQLRTQIIAEERSAAKAEVAARREKQRIARRNRQLAFEEATLREMTLLQELEKERAAEAERDIERQRLLEKERAKTRELRLSLDIETERRSQREYQRELEQRETGVVRTSTRREFASNTTSSSRPRERYREREREGQRTGQEGPARANSDVGARETATTPPATPTAGAPATSVSTPPTATSNTSSSRGYAAHERDRDRDRDRDRSDERGGFEDSGDANGAMPRDATEGTGLNDDGVPGVEGSSAGSAGTGHRQGPRSARPRQIVERRERDGRREGKWERKQT
ncbi:hypothetical protein M758_12G097000 [Ceratodon purpureus]|nr:hypothetical protein M758_12G097000 [Ceratodon purpureus]